MDTRDIIKIMEDCALVLDDHGRDDERDRLLKASIALKKYSRVVSQLMNAIYGVVKFNREICE